MESGKLDLLIDPLLLPPLDTGVEQIVAWGVTVTVPDAPEDDKVSTDVLSAQLLLAVNVSTSTDNC